MKDAPDTIVAVATAPGRGGIGIVRLSGPDAVAVAERLVRLVGAGELGDAGFHARARRAVVVDPEAPLAGQKQILRDAQDDNKKGGGDEGGMDEALVTVFHAPRSYTGEDVVEIAAHGAPVVMEALVHGAIASGAKAPLSEGELTYGLKPVPFKTEAAGSADLKPVPLKAEEVGTNSLKPLRFKTARLARPGEFTQRAFLAGRMDLTQAEAVGDLIAAQTLEQARAAAQQLGGALSRRVAPAKELLLHLIALLEAGMDFASGELDDVDVVAPEQIAAEIAGASAPLRVLAESFRRGQLLRHGAAIAIVGRPNAGKSSLFNRLLERERAIVTPLPGTTRDTVEESLALGGVPVRLVDTAGIRLGEDAADEAERQGIVRSHEALADADLVLLVHDASVAVAADEAALMEQLAGRPHLLVENKCDLVMTGASAEARALTQSSQSLSQSFAKDSIRTSALTGEGIGALRAAILSELGAAGSLAEGGLLNNLRQQEAVVATLAALDAAADASENKLPHEIVLLELHHALRALDSLTGETTSDDILGRIFATFCIGK